MKKFSYKIFRQGEDVLLAISDSSIVGKNFEDGKLQIFLSKEFYSENYCDEQELERLIESATIINAVGNEIISFLLEKNIIDNDKILKIKGVPHAQIISIK